MNKRAMAVIAVVALVSLLPTAGLALTPYFQDFETLDPADTAALTNDGWLVFGNVFGYDLGYWYGYGPFGAPNDGAAFCALVSGQGGAEQGAVQLSVFSDYNNADHPQAWIESNVFQEQTVEAGDVGSTYVFEFDAKMGNLELRSTAAAFIKTLDPGNGWAMTNYITADMTAIPDTWGRYSVSLAIDASLVGQVFQFGFTNMAAGYEGSGIFYDNLLFDVSDPTATQESSWSDVKSLF